MQKCIFCEIVKERAPAYRIWEDKKYIAFLSIYPNTEGCTVVIPKKHYPSYVFELSDTILLELIRATKKVALLLDKSFKDVGRTGMVLEGFGVDHVHTKLFPMHGTRSKVWKQRSSNINTYFKRYQGYLSSHDSKRADDKKLARLAQRIRDSLD